MSAREWQLLAIQGADHSAGFRERRSLLRGLPGGGPAAGSFKFLSVFKWEERKAWRVLLRACVNELTRRTHPMHSLDASRTLVVGASRPTGVGGLLCFG